MDLNKKKLRSWENETTGTKDYPGINRVVKGHELRLHTANIDIEYEIDIKDP